MNLTLKSSSHPRYLQRSSGLAALWLLSLMPAAANLYLTEFLADNTAGLRDSDGEYSDWIEIFNASPVPADLEGHYLTDDESALTK